MEESRYEIQHRAFLAEVQLRYRSQFGATDGEPVELTVGPGWYDLLRELFAAVAASLPAQRQPAFRWRAIRELGGRLCVSQEGGSRAIEELIRTAALRADSTCRVCGEPGSGRQVNGGYAVDCERHFIERLLRCAWSDESSVRAWLTTPRADLDDLCPRDAMGDHGHLESLRSEALFLSLPPAPTLRDAECEHLAGIGREARRRLGLRLQSLRVAETVARGRRAVTLLAVLDRPRWCDDARSLMDAINTGACGDIRPQLVSDPDLSHPLTADDPWPAMVARYASVEVSGS